MDQAANRRDAFVVRIWHEDGIPWRGWVQHAGSCDEAYVRSVVALLAFLEEYAGPLSAQGATELGQSQPGG